MTTSDSGSLVIQTQDGAFYRIPASQLQSYRMTDADVQGFLQTQQITTPDVQGYALTGGQQVALTPMLVLLPHPTMAARVASAVTRSWRTA